MTENDLDPYYYARDHDKGGWCVRGDDGLYVSISNLDKNVAYIIGKMLSGKFREAKSLLDSLVEVK